MHVFNLLSHLCKVDVLSQHMTMLIYDWASGHARWHSRRQLANSGSHIALVSQNITLFDDTVAANIAHGAMATAPRATIEEAVDAAHALEFILELMQGFDSIVGDNGICLSGGQQQHLTIARAILKNAPVLMTRTLPSGTNRGCQVAVAMAIPTSQEVL